MARRPWRLIGALGVFAGATVMLAAPEVASAAPGVASSAIGASGTLPDPVAACPTQVAPSPDHCPGFDTSSAANDVVLRVGDRGSVATTYTTAGAEANIVITQTLPNLADGTPSGVWRVADPGCSAVTGINTPTMTCRLPDVSSPTAFSVSNAFQLSQRALDGATVTVATTVNSTEAAALASTPVTFVASAGAANYRISPFATNRVQQPYKDTAGNVGVLQWMGVEVVNDRTASTWPVYGNQAPAAPITFTLDVSGVPGIQLMNWGAYGNGCGHNTQSSAFPNGGQPNTAVDYGLVVVTSTGPVSCTQPGGPGTPITMTLAANANTALVNLPTQPVIERAWIAFWVPSATAPATATATMTPTGFTTSSVAGGPITGTMTAGSVSLTNQAVGTADTPGNKVVTTQDANPNGSHLSNNGGSLATCDHSSWPGQCAMRLATVGSQWPPATPTDPALTYTVNVPIANAGTAAWQQPVVCDKWDRTTTLLTNFPSTGSPVAVTTRQLPAGPTDYGVFGPYSPSGSYNGTSDFSVAPAGYTLEYGVTPALTSPAAITNLSCNDPSITYHPSLAAAGGATQVNVVRLTLTGELGPSQQVALKLNLQAQLTYNGGPNGGQPVGPDVLMPDSMTFRNPAGSWRTFANRGAISPGIPEMRYGVSKSVSPSTVNPAVGSTATFRVASAQIFGYEYDADTAYRIVDRLPAGYTFMPGSASEAPAAVLPQADGSTLLVWDRMAVYPGVHNYAQAVPNPDITYQATLSTLTPNGTPIDNQVQIFGLLPDGTVTDSVGVVYCGTTHLPYTVPPTATYPAPLDVTFPPPGLQAGCSGYWRHYGAVVQVAANPLVLAVDKSVATPQVQPGDDNSYAIVYRNLQAGSLASTDLIDVLPFNGDGRTPASAFAGTIALASAPTTTDSLAVPPNPLPGGGAVTAGSTFYFTSAAPGSVNGDPNAASNQNGGATTWCLEADFGDAGCPTSLATVTAVRVIGGPLASGVDRTVTVPVVTSGNAAGDTYSNVAAVRTPSLPDLASSTTATFTVVLSSISGELFNDPDTDGLVDAGETGRYAGVTVRLLDASSNVVDTTQTDGSGVYTFTGLVAGDYTVAVDLSTAAAGMATLYPAAHATLPAGASRALTVGIGATAGSDFGFVDASLALTKSVAETTYGVGTVLHYTFTVTNTGQGPVDGLTVDDALAGVSTPVCDTTTLAPTDSATCTATYVAGQSDIDAGAITNTATASATLTVGGSVESPEATATVTTTQTSGITIAKSTTATFFDGAGDAIPFVFVVRNTGNVSIASIAVTDALIPSVTCPGTTLAGGASMTCSGTYTTDQDDVDTGEVVNIAGVTARTAGGDDLLAGSNQVVVPALQHAELTIVKATTTAFVSSVGEPIPYTFTVTNLGNVTIDDVVVTDELVPSVSCPATELAPGTSTICTGTYATTQADLDAGHVDNVATLSGVDPDGGPVTATSAVVVVPALHTPRLSIVKATTATTFGTVDESIPYTFLVTNTGNVTLTDVAVTDLKVAAVSCPATTLAPGASTTCTGSYLVTQDDLDTGSITNQASVVAVTPSGVDTNPVASNEVVISATEAPGAIVVKSTTATFYDTVGDEIAYTFAVTNTGNVTLTDVTVNDPLLGGVVCTLPQLAPGEADECTASHTVTAGDLDAGQIVNQASITGEVPPASPALPPTVSETVTVPAIYRPELTIVKSSTTIVLDAAGQVIPYAFSVINTGNVTIDDITVADPLLAGVTCQLSTLPIGEQTTCAGSYTATQADVDAAAVVNQATVDGAVPDGAPALAPADSNEVRIPADQQPAITVAKSADVARLTAAGQVVTYRFTVSNDGNTTLTDIAVDDPKVPGVSCPAADVAPGATVVCTGTYTATQADIDAGSVTNTATATAATITGAALLPVTSNTLVIPVERRSSLTVVKATPVTVVSAVGQQVPFTFTVTNGGNTTLSGIVVSDAKVPSVTCPATTLAPGRSMVCTASYTVTQADATAGRVTNVASVRGTGPGGAALPEVTSNEVQVPFATTPPTTPPPPTGPVPTDPGPTTPNPGELPATGAGRVGEIAMLAALLVVAGGVITAVGRGRRQRRAPG